MSRRHTLTLIDPDVRRRAALSFALGRDDWHVEPHESLAELALSPPRRGALLVADEPDLVEAVLTFAASHCPSLPVIAFHPQPQPRRIVALARGGVQGYLAHPFSAAELADVLDEAIVADPAGQRDPLRGLTAREREVFEAAAAGMTSRTIGVQLAISRRTVDAHRVNLLHKMGVSSIAEAVRLTRGNGEPSGVIRSCRA